MDEHTVFRIRDESSLAAVYDLLQKRDCFQCDPNQRIGCPATCPGQCEISVPRGCTSCAVARCLSDDASSPDGVNGGVSGDDGDDGGTVNAGAIAGGVIGGIVLIAVVTYLLWRFFVKPKRAQLPSSIFEADSSAAGALEKDAEDDRMTRRSSTHTVHSIASTVLTRASNIIQIAYIPGVTNRAAPSSPTVLVPPVPPIPMQHADGNRDSTQDDPHFFVPGDLRDSTYSGFSGYSDRTSYARTSYAPRSSVASTIYGKQTQVMHPVQTGMRAKPTMVSVKSVTNTPQSTPPVPALDLERFADQRPRSTVSNFSVGSTFLNNANTVTTARAQVVQVGSGLKKIEVASLKSESSSTTKSVDPPSPDESIGESVRSLGAMTTPHDRSPAVDQGPFSDPPDRPSPLSSNSRMLGAVMEEDSEDGRSSRNGGSAAVRESSPFDDNHATKG
ncbi:hypothetical protein B0I35DRAFT_474683 [Stachybotrys elegans]|uniref:Membrane anchor Opy2 N-terminal domain-containing protein n=1 Tax=Stachybotrys elegans TaxID=80388 RepID=A0A8K0SZ86_9HYPO|nr:hypothetical protein B0I35DRAFT_474683 [Stachybotrys elegans]